MLDDEAYLERLLEILTVEDGDESTDGIDRHDGFGRHYGVNSLRVVPSEDGFDDLEAACWLRPLWWLRWRHRRRTYLARVLFDHQWRIDSGLQDPTTFAPRVADAAYFSAIDHDVDPPGERDRVRREIGTVEDLWGRLVAHLEPHGGATDSGTGRLLVVDREDGETVEVHIMPGEWHEHVVSHELSCRADSGVDAWERGDGLDAALMFLDETIGGRWDDETHVVFFRGSFERSVRARLPPVGGSIFEGEQVEALGDAEPGAFAEQGAFAHPPDGEVDVWTTDETSRRHAVDHQHDRVSPWWRRVVARWRH